MIVKSHGVPPWRAAVIHGGPGAAGSATALARRLAERAGIGVLEPWQSRHSIAELIDELNRQLARHESGPTALIGHSWGAWLAALYAARHPLAVSKLILVGAGALDATYVEAMNRRRLERFAPEQRVRYEQLCRMLARPRLPDRDLRLAELGALCDAADTFCALPECESHAAVCDGAIYAKVWAEAAHMRASGELLAAFSGIACPLTVIHGSEDTTPPEAVAEPLKRAGAPHSLHVLPECGHTPWCERYAALPFFELLAAEITG